MTINADDLPIELAKGSNVALRDLDEQLGSLTAVLETTGADGQDIDADVSVLLLGDDGRVRSNDDFVFFNQPIASSGAVHLRDKIRSEDETNPVTTDIVTLELDAVPDDVQRIVMCASLDPGLDVTFGHASAVCMKVRRSDNAAVLLTFSAVDASTERAWIFGEFYRRQQDWKFRAIGQGFDEGLGRLAGEYGVDVDSSDVESTDDDPPIAPAPDAPDAPDVQPPEPTPDGNSIDNIFVPDSTESDDPAPRLSVKRPARAPKLAADWDRTVPDDSDNDWQPARLFPIAGIGGAAEQERRATSALLAVMRLVKEFGRSVLTKLGAPAGAIETYIEVPFGLGDQAYRPDGVIRVTRGERVWTTLVEVKTSDAKLGAQQVDSYVDIARDKNLDAVLTISNQLIGSTDAHPVDIDRRKLKKVSLHHLSWDQIRTEALLLVKNKKVSDPTQLRILEEFLRYMTHARSGLHGFTDMGPLWVKVRDAVRAQTLRGSDRGCGEITDQFDRLIQRVSLDLSGMLGVETSATPPRNRADATTRHQQLADSGQLFGSIRVPGAIDRIVVEADLRTEHVCCSVRVDAPREGRPLTRVNWLLRQMPDVRDTTRVEALLSGGRGHSTVSLLGALRKRPETLVPDDGRDIRAFRIGLDTNMGTRRGRGSDGFVVSVHVSVVKFYAEVVQHLRPWNSRTSKPSSIEAD